MEFPKPIYGNSQHVSLKDTLVSTTFENGHSVDHIVMSDDFELGFLDYDARRILTSVISLNGEHSLMKRPHSQTPLDPARLIDSGMPYLSAVNNALEIRVHDRSRAVGLPDYYTEAIGQEVAVEIDKRTTNNNIAAKRLLEKLDGQTLTREDAELIWAARVGEADLTETGRLLLQHPEIGSIEGMKYTLPLDWTGINEMNKEIAKGLGKFRQNFQSDQDDGLRIEMYDPSDKDKRNLRPLIPKSIPDDPVAAFRQAAILGLKDNIGEVSENGTTIQLVQKTTMVKISPSTPLHMAPFIRRYQGTDVNLQPIAKMCYWRVIDSER